MVPRSVRTVWSQPFGVSWIWYTAPRTPAESDGPFRGASHARRILSSGGNWRFQRRAQLPGSIRSASSTSPSSRRALDAHGQGLGERESGLGVEPLREGQGHARAAQSPRERPHQFEVGKKPELSHLPKFESDLLHARGPLEVQPVPQRVTARPPMALDAARERRRDEAGLFSRPRGASSERTAPRSRYMGPRDSPRLPCRPGPGDTRAARNVLRPRQSM